MKFKINKFLSLRLEDSKTNIYVGGKIFQQCKFLLLQVPLENNSDLISINSIDEAAEKLDGDLEEADAKEKYNIKPEEEFWAHCSNLQVWAENNYDSRLLHRNLAFPLLKELSRVGDLNALNIFKEEIIYRYLHGTENVQKYLIEEGFLDLMADEETHGLIESEEDLKALQQIEELIGIKLKIDTEYFHFRKSFVVRGGKIVELNLCQLNIGKIPESVQKLKNLEKLVVCGDHSIKFIPSWIGNLPHLKNLVLAGLDITTLPESIGNLISLEKLYLSGTKLESLPESFGRLIHLTDLDLRRNALNSLPKNFGKLTNLETLDLEIKNQLTTLPESFGDLKSLKKLIINENKLQSLPESFGNLESLEELELYKNNLKSLPKSIENLNSLEYIVLNCNEFREFPSPLINCKSLKTIYLEGNKIEMIPQSIVRCKSLERLYLRDNKIQIFPSFLETLELKQLYLNGYSRDGNIN